MGQINKSYVVDTTNSPQARLRPVPIDAVRLQDSFWAPRLRLLREVTMSTQYQLMEETGRLWNFKRGAGKSEGPFRVFSSMTRMSTKWVEGVAFCLASMPDARLKNLVSPLIDDIVAV